VKISIDNNISNKLIWVTVSCFNAGEIELREQFDKTVLLKLLDGSSMSLITFAPQKYSLAHDIGHCQSKILGDNCFLVNSIVSCDPELIKKIVSSEEFRRTLLVVVKERAALPDSDLIKLLDLVKGRSAIEIAGVIYCEDDGNSLCLYNMAIDLKDLMFMARTLTANVVIEMF